MYLMLRSTWSELTQMNRFAQCAAEDMGRGDWRLRMQGGRQEHHATCYLVDLLGGALGHSRPHVLLQLVTSAPLLVRIALLLVTNSY